MHGSGLTRYPHLSWLAYGVCIKTPRTFVLHEYKAVAHRLILTEEGDANLSWAIRGTAVARHVSCGSLVFCPADLGLHSLGITSAGGYRAHVLLMPIAHLESVCEAEGARHDVGLCVLPVFRDAVLLACAHRLFLGETRGHVTEDVGAEIAARQVLIRLAAVTGGRSPDWIRDTSVFTPCVMRQIVERVDARLMAHPTLAEMSTGFGLSPSHFARKFQHSTGLSLNRFMNRRRIGLSLALLKTGRTPLAQLSLDLGFSSQSHFTRLFSSLTGITPYQFQRSQRRMGG